MGVAEESDFEMTFSFILLAALDLGALFSSKEAWRNEAELFAVEHAKAGFAFASEDRQIVNCLNPESCTWFGRKVWETKVYFDKSGEEETIARVELSLYNRGDARGERFSVDDLKKLLTDVSAKLAPGEKKFKDEKQVVKNGALQYRRAFPKGEIRGELAWGLSPLDGDNKRSVDYVRLTLSRTSAPAKKGAARSAGASGKAKILENVTKSPNGDVFIANVPMVDQGRKGYCAAAVAERVLRYYGQTIDEHEIAQQAGTTAEGGTSVAAMREVITAVGEKNGLGFQEIVSLSPRTIADIEEELAKYNKAAKAEKKEPLEFQSFRSGNSFDYSAMREAMAPKVIYKMRLKDPNRKKFLTAVRRRVDEGIPVFWGVTLGIFPERGVNPQSSGGHMRLVIGYNDKKREILYTDTWGEGHELKRMPEDWAFAITHDAFFLKPR